VTARKASSAYFSLRMVPPTKLTSFARTRFHLRAMLEALRSDFACAKYARGRPSTWQPWMSPPALFSACALTPRVALAERSPTSGASPCMQSSDVKLTKDTEGRFGQRCGCQSIVFQAGPMRRPSIGRYRCECVPSPTRKVRTTPWHCRPRGIGALDASTHRWNECARSTCGGCYHDACDAYRVLHQIRLGSKELTSKGKAEFYGLRDRHVLPAEPENREDVG